MIEERFLQSAVNIRRTYLKVSNNLTMYHKRAAELIKSLNQSIERIDALKEDLEKNPNQESGDSINKLLSIIKDVEDEGLKIENLTEPMNKEIEKLAKDEQELYLQIKRTHPNLSDDVIIKSVQDRLEREGLI